MPFRHYYSKLLLFGEHTILKGSHALAIPFSQFSGHWAYASREQSAKGMQEQLSDFALYLKDLQRQGQLLASLNLVEFERALAEGLYFHSTIPKGSGVGSSGALCAAVLEDFGANHAPQKKSLAQLQETLAQLENFFHGKSSGTDPLISYLNQAVLIAAPGNIKAVELPQANAAGEGMLFLLDTHASRSTSYYVQFFLDLCTEKAYLERLEAELIPTTDEAIAAFLNGRWSLLFELLHPISLFQYRYFDAMIPVAFRSIWLQGLAGDQFKLKLCGAGGGGFLLGMAKNWSLAQKQLKGFDTIEVLRF